MREGEFLSHEVTFTRNLQLICTGKNTWSIVFQGQYYCVTTDELRKLATLVLNKLDENNVTKLP